MPVQAIERNKMILKRQLFAGKAQSDITAELPDEKINDPLYSKAIVMDDGRTRLAIITMDVTAIGGRDISHGLLDDVGEQFLPALRSRIERELNIPGRNVVVNASHTHPPGRMLCSDDEQLERTFDAVRRAAQNMFPVTIGTGSGHEDRLTLNRTLRMKDGSHWTIRHANPCPLDKDIAGLGPSDTELGVIRIDKTDGTPLAVIYNFACHLLCGIPGKRITANLPGFASRVIEENLGHNAMAMFLQGAGGDVVDINFKNVDSPRNNEYLGIMLGLDTLAIRQKIKTGNAELSVISETIALPRRTDIPDRIEHMRHEQAELLKSLRFTSLNFKTFLPLYIKYALNPDFPSDYAYKYLHEQQLGTDGLKDIDAENRANLNKYLENIQAMEKLSRIEDKIATLLLHKAINDKAMTKTIDTEIQGIKLGDCVLVTAPVEMLTEAGLNLKQASPYPHTFIAAYSNGYMHYAPPAADYDKGGYEVTECFLAPEWQQIFEQKVQDIFKRLLMPDKSMTQKAGQREKTLQPICPA